jgi:hypothetical protein
MTARCEVAASDIGKTVLAHLHVRHYQISQRHLFDSDTRSSIIFRIYRSVVHFFVLIPASIITHHSSLIRTVAAEQSFPTNIQPKTVHRNCLRSLATPPYHPTTNHPSHSIHHGCKHLLPLPRPRTRYGNQQRHSLSHHPRVHHDHRGHSLAMGVWPLALGVAGWTAGGVAAGKS